jgi:hypothetical protein
LGYNTTYNRVVSRLGQLHINHSERRQRRKRRQEKRKKGRREGQGKKEEEDVTWEKRIVAIEYDLS